MTQFELNCHFENEKVMTYIFFFSMKMHRLEKTKHSISKFVCMFILIMRIYIFEISFIFLLNQSTFSRKEKEKNRYSIRSLVYISI